MVETEYFYWLDDDFDVQHPDVFSELFRIIEASGFDIVGGVTQQPGINEWLSYGSFNLDFSNDGVCFNEFQGQYGFLPGFEKEGCVVQDLAANFFIGRTLAASTIRFDPQFKRTGHTQWFLDAYTTLRIAVCPNIVIINDNQCCVDNDIKCETYKRTKNRLIIVYNL